MIYTLEQAMDYSTWYDLLREASTRITWKSFKKLCFIYADIISKDTKIKKVHFMGCDDGKITVFYEYENYNLVIKKTLVYQYLTEEQKRVFALRLERVLDKNKFGISIRRCYKNYPCLTIYSK